jgi:hypothetical protein
VKHEIGNAERKNIRCCTSKNVSASIFINLNFFLAKDKEQIGAKF